MTQTAAPGGASASVVLRLFIAVAAAFGCGISAAQTDDPAAPFLGTWSGVFTTTDHEFWKVEDFACFPGCARSMREHMRALLADPANDEVPVGALLGQAYAFAAEQIATILTPLGKRIQAENSLDNDPKLHCEPYGFVRQVTNPLPMIIRRNGEHLLFEYEEWSLLRTVYLDGRPHPAHRTPSLLGHSVGRFEDGALVIETTRVHAGWISDATQAGHSDRLSAVERYTVHDNPRRLELELTIEDPLTLTEPYVIVKTWLYTPDVELVQDRCRNLPGVF
ncbi:MAG: hypothetical protein WBE98_15595 [Gammaproteobacteria bacterium]|nr:hypothetical protein [Gammaproteobacteria bacterium]